MKIAVIPKPQELEIREIPIPDIDDDQVLVKVSAVGVCTFEQKYFKGINGSEEEFPFLGGHEICGIVEKVGSKVAQKLVPGDKVVVASLTRCGECYYCRRGLDNQCLNQSNEPKVKGYTGPAGFSEYFAAKGYEVYKIAQDTKDEIGTLAEPLACVGLSIQAANLQIGDYVLVLGCGIMGLLHVMLAKMRGATVIVSEPDENRRKKAIQMGADFAIDPLTENLNEIVLKITDGLGVEATFFTAGGKRAIDDGIALLKKRGTIVIYGATGKNDTLSIDPKVFHYKEIFITGVISHTKESFRQAAQLISSGSLDLEGLISEVYDLSEVHKAFERAQDMSTYRVVVRF